MERNGWIEFEKRSGANRHEGLSGKLERDDVTIARRRVTERLHTSELRGRYQRGVELGRFFCLFVEPQMRRDFVRKGAPL